jgi:hypothetical protein
MEYGHDIVCPKCERRHGSAAKECECGHVFEVVKEDPAPPAHFLIFGTIMLIGCVVVAKAATNRGLVFLPIFGIIGGAVAYTLALRSWLYFRRKDKARK